MSLACCLLGLALAAAQQPRPSDDPFAPIPGVPETYRSQRQLAEERARRTPGWERPVATATGFERDADLVKSLYFTVPVHVHPSQRHYGQRLCAEFTSHADVPGRSTRDGVVAR